MNTMLTFAIRLSRFAESYKSIKLKSKNIEFSNKSSKSEILLEEYQKFVNCLIGYCMACDDFMGRQRGTTETLFWDTLDEEPLADIDVILKKVFTESVA